MNTIMRVDASLQSAEQAVSKQLGEFLIQQLQPESLIHLDLADEPPQPMDGEFLEAMFAQEPTPEQKTRLRHSDRWIEQLKACDALVITTPMYNFGVPAHLKSFFDHILRAGKTFRYTEQGPVGLLENKPVFLVLTSGGNYREGEAQSMNFLDGHLKTMLNFIGLQDHYFIHAAGLAQNEPEEVIRQAQNVILQSVPQALGEVQSA